MKKEMFPVFQNFTAISIKIFEQSGRKATPEEIKRIILT